MGVEKIGDKDVLEAGTFLIAGGPNDATIDLRGLKYVVRILVSQDPPTGKLSYVDNTTAILTFVGALNAAGYTWGFSSVAKVDNKFVDLIIRIKYLAHAPGNPPVFGVDYTFTDAALALPEPAAA